MRGVFLAVRSLGILGECGHAGDDELIGKIFQAECLCWNFVEWGINPKHSHSVDVDYWSDECL